MQTKLTLRLEEQLVENAKRYAKQSGKSLSRMVADYFLQFEEQVQAHSLPPITVSLKGALASLATIDEADYHAYLERKYL